MPFAPFPSTKSVTSFLGIRNTSPIRSIPDNALSAASDIDLDNEGIITRRHGYARAATIASITAAYCTANRTPYIVANGILSRVDDTLGVIPLASSSATAFADHSNVLFTNDGLKVQADATTNLVFPPRGEALQLAVNFGLWPAGKYTAVYCYRSTISGIEGPSSEPASITIGNDQGVVVIPPAAVSGYEAVVYITDSNGSVFYDAAGVQINALQLGADVFPVGAEAIAFNEGSVYAAFPQSNGTSLIVWSYPAYHHLFNLAKNYCVVPGEVRDMKPISSGLLIATDSAIYIYADGALLEVANYGVPSGQSIAITSPGTAKIFTHQGVCEAPPFTNLTEAKAQFAPGKKCSTVLIERDGIQQFVVLTDGSGTPFNTRT